MIRGVTGKRAIHLMTPEDRKRVPEFHQMWIDIGAKDRKEALERVTIGDAAVYDHGLEELHGSLAVSRAFDDKSGAYAVNEALLRLSNVRKPPMQGGLQYPLLRKRLGREEPFPRLIWSIPMSPWWWMSVMPPIIQMRITVNTALLSSAVARSLPVGPMCIPEFLKD